MLQQEPIKELNEELNSELVFFDTFSHDNNEEVNLDLVQFRSPVLIKEIRIIPLGAKVEADFAGGWRLGATNPSSFDVLFYINDLTKTSNKFSKFGDFEYKESVNIKFVPDEFRPTDSLVLKGKYTILTLAVFAEIINENSIRKENDLVKITVDQKENEQNYQNNDFMQLDNETDTLHSMQSESCSSKTEIFERLNGRELDREIKLIEENTNQNRLEREIQPISSPTNDQILEDGEENDEPLKHVHLKSINDSESISSIEDIKNENRLIQNDEEIDDNNLKTTIVNETDSDLEPISPDQNDQQIDEQFDDDEQILNDIPTNQQDINDNNESTKIIEQSQNSDLMYISNLTEKVSDDEMCDFNNEFDANENSMNRRLESRSSTVNSEDLEEISSEEEYFEDVAGSPNDGELFVDYSDDEINQINFINEFNSNEYLCKPLISLDDISFNHYENLKLRNRFDENQQLTNEILYFNKQTEKDSKWVEFIENLDLNSLDLDKEELNLILIEWIKLGIDFELALNQKNTAFKVRHLKAGLKLLCSFIQTKPDLINKLLEERILEKLYKLFFKPYMSLPIKLLLIRTLDTFTDYSEVLENVLNFKYKLDNEFNQNLQDNLKDNLKMNLEIEDNLLLDKFNFDQVFLNNEKTIYQLLLILMMKSNGTNVTIALTILLRKIHFYEFLINFKEDVNQLFNNNQFNNENLITNIINNLNEITNSFRQSKELFGQRIRYLPAKTQFIIKPPKTKIIYAIYRWFNQLDFLNLIVNLCAGYDDNEQLIFSTLNFFNEILLQEQGTSYYLSSKVYNITNHLLEITNKQCNLIEDNDELNKDKNINQKLSTFNLNLKYNLYILGLIDQINKIQSSDEFKNNNSDDSELCLLYNKLFSIIFNELGSRYLIKQLCDNQNLDILIKFLITNKERSDKSRLVCFHYAINLLIHTIQYSKERLCELLIKYNDEFILLSNYSSVLSKWFSPLKRGIKFNYNESTFKLLVSNLKQHSERLKNLKENCTYRVSPDLICCVQILHYLCIDPNQLENQKYSDDQLLPNNQLKYKFGLIQLFELKGLTYILTIIERLAEIFLKPSHLNSSLIGSQGYFLIILFKPCIDILKQTLIQLTHCRGSDFKDTSPIKPLLKVYSLMLVFPLQSFYHLNSIQICNEIIIILHCYTQLNVNMNEVKDEVFNKSIWTKMVKEVIDFTTLKPFNFSHGLYLLSQLLPSPLNCKKIEDTNEITRLLNFRKLWSAHIYVLFSDIENMIQKLVLSLSPLIQYLLRRVCYQLIDLSSHAGIIISKCLLSVLDQHLISSTMLKEYDNLYSVLDLILYLLKYNLFRNALSCTVNDLNSSIKKDEKLDRTIRKTIELFKTNEEQFKKYSDILNILESKTITETTTDEQLDNLTQMEKLNLYYNNRNENLELDDLEDLNLLNLNRKLTKYDLIELSKRYISDVNFNVRNQLLVIYKNEEPNYDEQFKSLANKHKHEPIITKDYSGNVKRPYVAPLRGRGFQRSNNLGRLHDPFRSRPPNTSRPPSMHVDEYEKQVAMGQNNQQLNLKRQKQDFNKFNKLNPNQRTIRPNYYNNHRQLNNTRMNNNNLNINNNNNNRNTFNRYNNNLQTNYNNNGLNQSKMRKQLN